MALEEPCNREANTSRMQSAGADLRSAVSELRDLLADMNGEDCPKEVAGRDADVVRSSVCVSQVMNDYPDMMREQASLIRQTIDQMRGMF